MQDLTLEEIHREILNMMDYIHKLCEENGITYYVGFGSLIGAIRHNGFIPWDDDFDIMMPRADVEKFREIFLKTEHPYYRLCDRKNTKNYYYGIPRFSDSRYKHISTRKAVKQFDCGLFIDIYPLDNFGNTQEEAVRIKKKIARVNMGYDIYVNGKNARGGLASLAQSAAHVLLHAVHGPKYPQRIDARVQKILRRHTSDRDLHIGDVCWDEFISAYPREWFAERILHDFEDRKYWIPKGYDELLRQDYGDYMQMPPEPDRHPTHDYRIVKP